jgi:adenylate kinase
MLLKLLVSEIFVEYGRRDSFRFGQDMVASSSKTSGRADRARTARPGTGRRRTVALTGTPGVGKTSVARRLARRRSVVEVADLALQLGFGHRTSTTVVVDLARLQRRLRSPGVAASYDVYVGHLAHLLPISDVIVLRCEPRELERRLRRGRPGPERDLRQNVEAEAIGLIAAEALGLERRVWEIDTTGRSVPEVARAVDRLLAHRSQPTPLRVDWLADPAVTDYLLDRTT